MTNFVIYEEAGATSKECITDTQSLLKRFAESLAPDAVSVDILPGHSCEGAGSKTTFVLPGGNAYAMKHSNLMGRKDIETNPRLSNIVKEYQKGANLFGICAGGILLSKGYGVLTSPNDYSFETFFTLGTIPFLKSYGAYFTDDTLYDGKDTYSSQPMAQPICFVDNGQLTPAKAMTLASPCFTFDISHKQFWQYETREFAVYVSQGAQMFKSKIPPEYLDILPCSPVALASVTPKFDTGLHCGAALFSGPHFEAGARDSAIRATLNNPEGAKAAGFKTLSKQDNLAIDQTQQCVEDILFSALRTFS
jgi:hypothetical protein